MASVQATVHPKRAGCIAAIATIDDGGGRGCEGEGLVFIEAEEHLRRAHGPREMPPEVFATMVAATVEQLGDKLPDDVVVDIGEWRGPR